VRGVVGLSKMRGSSGRAALPPRRPAKGYSFALAHLPKQVCTLKQRAPRIYLIIGRQ
jgi:hypothetical protein